MIPNPILKVLSTMRAHRVKCLLMGGQACVLYGAVEFSRDTDLAILADSANRRRMLTALASLGAETIAVPPFELCYLKRGHAVHFRCHHPEADGMRIDVMSVMRGVAPFPALWRRRLTVALSGGASIAVLSLPDLVQAKKTQRDKDWLMLKRLIEAHYAQNRRTASTRQVSFWLMQCRTPEILTEVATRNTRTARALAKKRALLVHAVERDEHALVASLAAEEQYEREQDREYWLPLRRELEQVRHGRFAGTKVESGRRMRDVR